MDATEQRTQVLKRHQRRLEDWEARLAARDGRFFWLRLGSLVGGAMLTWLVLAFGPPGIGIPVLILALALFAAVVYFHRRLDRARARVDLALRRTRTQIARLQLDWPHIPAPPPGLPVPAPEHPFAADLNLTGLRSLHQLLDTAISKGGSARLQDWLLDPLPNPEQVQSRQAVLGELIPRSGFRSTLALKGGLAARASQERWDEQALIRWLESERGSDLRRPLLVMTGLAVLNLVLFGLNSLGLLPPLWVGSFIFYVLIYFSQYQTLGDLFGDAQHLSVALGRFREVLIYLERYPFPAGSRLAMLAQVFKGGEVRPSQILRRLSGIASAASLQNNAFLWAPLNALMPWDLFFAYQLHQSKERLRSLLPAWLEAWYELEALSSLANFAYLNPAYAFPQVQLDGDPDPDRPVFAARQLGHPLIPASTRVSNDFTASHLGEVVIITGSNMSGKSTFLRTLGINLCLAYAGGPVCAAELDTLPFRLFTSLNVSDSLSDGISFFYAEVRRLRTLLDQLREPHPYPLFFLIDEIFRGTNNRERAIGSRSYVSALVDSPGVGVISTHDLELVHLEDEFPSIENYHFREDVRGGEMVFDYRLRPGPSPTTNALRIMELAGLPVRQP